MATRTKNGGKTDSRMSRMIVTKHDMPAENRAQMIELLNQQLADTFDLFSLTKQAHWNVKGPNFYQLHELYDEMAETLIGHIDMIAERATALGGPATGTVRMAASASRLEEFPAGFVGSMESIRQLVERYANLARTTRQAIDEAEEVKDMDTSDLFIDISRDIDKFLWFLESHVQMGE